MWRVQKGTTCVAKICVPRQTLKTRLARETSMRPAATRPAWRHERVKLEQVINYRGGSNELPDSSPSYGHVHAHSLTLLVIEHLL